MARARNIKPGFFKNEDLAECSLAARLCFAGLWTLADREGRLEDRPKRIKGELFPFDAFDAEPLLQELSRFGFIVRYEVDGQRCIQVSKFLEHQTPHYTEKDSVIKPAQLQESGRQSTTPDSKKTPGVKAASRGGQNPLNPDSPNPDSPKKTSEPIGSAAAAPPASPEPEPMTEKERLWALGIAILGDKGRSFLGKAVSTWGEGVVLECLEACNAENPGEPKGWITKALESRGKAPKSAGQRVNGNHSATTEDLLNRDPKPDWALQAGFSDLWQAESAGCGPGNASQFRNGRRVTQ